MKWKENQTCDGLVKLYSNVHFDICHNNQLDFFSVGRHHRSGTSRTVHKMEIEIDYECTQLNDAELAEHLERKRQREHAEVEAERRRWVLAKNFHFSGGML